MNNLDLLEHGGGLFQIRHRGEIISMPDPRRMHYQDLLLCINLRMAPGIPQDVPMWAWPQIYERWAAAADLPEFGEARRLAYLVDHYRGAIANDLMVYAGGLDLGTLWRERRWRLLIDVIDRLPGHGHFSAAVANDEEHAEMVAKAAADRGETAPGAKKTEGPSLIGWSPEVAMLARILDATNNVRYAVVASQVGKKAGDPPKPAQRPVTALEKAFRKAEYHRRQKAHDDLVARVLPKKRGVKTPSEG